MKTVIFKLPDEVLATIVQKVVWKPEEASLLEKWIYEGEELKTFPKFRVIDNKTGKEPDFDDIVLHEEWAYESKLVRYESEGFAITNNGDLIMLDECGNYEFCPQGRFTVVTEGAEE